MSTTHFLNMEVLDAFDADRFVKNKPFPWCGFSDLLTADAFQRLHDEYPPLELFEFHQGHGRPNNQRSHDYHYLSYKKSRYGRYSFGQKGICFPEQLTPSWREFIEDLRESSTYHKFIKRLLGVDEFEIRFSWHAMSANTDISPHCDLEEKLATQIFYFNSDDNWQSEWNGATVFLGQKRVERLNPEIADFDQKLSADFLRHQCVLFKNTADAWHAVEPLRCPEGFLRRTFNVIFDTPVAASKSVQREEQTWAPSGIDLDGWANREASILFARKTGMRGAELHLELPDWSGLERQHLAIKMHGQPDYTFEFTPGFYYIEVPFPASSDRPAIDLVAGMDFTLPGEARRRAFRVTDVHYLPSCQNNWQLKPRESAG